MFQLPDKGTFGYFDKKKKMHLILTILGFLSVLIIFLTGVITYHHNKSIFTVIAAVAVLPAAKMLVGYIILAPYYSVSKEQYEEITSLIKEQEDCRILCDILLASQEKSMIAGMTVLCAGHILMYTDSKRADAAGTEAYLKKILESCQYSSVKLYTDYKVFKKQICRLIATSVTETEDEKKRQKTMCERIAHNILIYTI